MTSTILNLKHSAEVCELAANFVTDEKVLPCREGNDLAEALCDVSMYLREMHRERDNLHVVVCKSLAQCTCEESSCDRCEPLRAAVFPTK